VHGGEAVEEAAQRFAQPFVGSDLVGPHRVASRRRDEITAFRIEPRGGRSTKVTTVCHETIGAG
jgi:hypothetical protein